MGKLSNFVKRKQLFEASELTEKTETLDVKNNYELKDWSGRKSSSTEFVSDRKHITKCQCATHKMNWAIGS